MKLLLDTHAFLWFINNDPRLSSTAIALITNQANERYLSIASLWEIAIKVGIGKLQLPQPFEQFITEQLAINKTVVLDLRIDHLSPLTNLPQHHRDPFDRLLIVQAIVENLILVSADSAFRSYPVQRIW
jgi:PIN domain nuclease of toxin-antitoxin system